MVRTYNGENTFSTEETINGQVAFELNTTFEIEKINRKSVFLDGMLAVEVEDVGGGNLARSAFEFWRLDG